MLSRTAACVFWMARYLERAESMARLLDVTQQLGLMPETEARVATLPLAILDIMPAYEATGAACDAESVARYLLLSSDSPYSIRAALRLARENAHVVRGTISSELWEVLNATWLEARAMTPQKLASVGLTQSLDWVKERCHLARGVLLGASQRDDAYRFAMLGMHLERADNTVRLLRSYLEAFAEPDATGRPSYYVWTALLRALSAFEAYRDRYSDSLNVAETGELLIFCEALPRSLRACVQSMDEALAGIPGETGRLLRRRVAVALAELRTGDWAQDFAAHPVQALDAWLETLAAIGEDVQNAYWSAS